jgi:uncharacterized membrane protein YtjA (UPF0391 family)
MIYWALLFLLVAFIAAVFGFTGIAPAAAGVAKLLFFIFLAVRDHICYTPHAHRQHQNLNFKFLARTNRCSFLFMPCANYLACFRQGTP